MWRIAGSLRMAALNDAFHDPAGWDAFKATVKPKQAHAFAWVQANDQRVSSQVAERHLLPDHHSSAALDQPLGAVRDMLDARSFTLRNKRRTTTMLGLVREHLNGVDNERQYATLLRTCLDAHHGMAPGQRGSYDEGTSRRTPAAQRQLSSLQQ